jgi:oxalate decarboxylase/phosphoglucose isomerase-like protein (cupin superfamily)
MGLIDRLAFIPRRLLADERGWFLKVLDGGEAGLPGTVGEVYLTQAVPGQARGNHYHPECDEWFTVVSGRALLIVGDPQTGERAQHWLDADEPVTVHMPAGLAHVFVNPPDANSDFLLIAYAANRYDPADTVPHTLWP